MAELVKYVARQRFKYNGILYKPGDEWTPLGVRYDASIIRNRLVSTVRIEAPLNEPEKAAAKSPAKGEKTPAIKRYDKE